MRLLTATLAVIITICMVGCGKDNPTAEAGASFAESFECLGYSPDYFDFRDVEPIGIPKADFRSNRAGFGDIKSPDRLSAIAESIELNRDEWELYKDELRHANKLEIAKSPAPDFTDIQGNGEYVSEEPDPSEFSNGCPVERLNWQIRVAVLRHQLENSSHADSQVLREKLNQARAELKYVEGSNRPMEEKSKAKAEDSTSKSPEEI